MSTSHVRVTKVRPAPDGKSTLCDVQVVWLTPVPGTPDFNETAEVSIRDGIPNLALLMVDVIWWCDQILPLHEFSHEVANRRVDLVDDIRAAVERGIAEVVG